VGASERARHARLAHIASSDRLNTCGAVAGVAPERIEQLTARPAEQGRVASD
jgi:hypothetical protein